MAGIGVAMLEKSASPDDRIEDAAGREHGPDRLVTATQPLGDRHDVRRNPLLLTSVKGTRAAHATHHLVENEQHPIAVADLTNPLEVSRNRRGTAERRP